MFKNPVCKLSFLLVLALVLLLCLYWVTHGWALLLWTLLGAIWAVSGHNERAVFVYLSLPFITTLNPLLLPRFSFFSEFSRLSMLLMSAVLILKATGVKRTVAIPLAGLFVYLSYAFFSSLQGWFPLISFFKIVNFAFFLVTLTVVSKLAASDPGVARYARASFFAFCILYVYGSLATLPFPAIAYLTTFSNTISSEGLQAVEDLYQSNRSGMLLFSGITYQSQFLGPLLPCVAGWVLCDALLVERRIPLFHCLLLIPIPVMLFMTRSRLAFVTFCAAIGLIVFFLLPRARMNRADRRKIQNIGLALAVACLLGGLAIEIKDQSISRWLRKVETVDTDTRSLKDAITNSRRGVIGRCWEEFERNPLLGSGFQVIQEHPQMFRDGWITLFSAPVEKGVLPLMVLGETGVIGEILFLGFLAFFYYTCTKRRLYAAETLFSVYLVTNVAEATFFSPSGAGGIEWVFTALGGFVIDVSDVSRTDPLFPLQFAFQRQGRKRIARRKYKVRGPEPSRNGPGRKPDRAGRESAPPPASGKSSPGHSIVGSP